MMMRTNLILARESKEGGTPVELTKVIVVWNKFSTRVLVVGRYVDTAVKHNESEYRVQAMMSTG